MAGTGLIFSLLFAIIDITGPTDAEILRAAETAFDHGLRAQGKEATSAFALAAAHYDKLRHRGIRNSALYRNQGNAFLLAGDLPRAILAYRRGLHLAPNDADLRDQLAHAREQVAYSVPGSFGRPPVDSWPPWLPHPTNGLCFITLIVSYSLAWLAGTRWLMTRHGELLAAASLALVLATVPAAYLAWDEWTRCEELHHPLVIVAADNVALAKGNGRLYPTYPTPLPRGVEARLRFERGDWLQIELAGGEIGWLPRRAVVMDDKPNVDE